MRWFSHNSNGPGMGYDIDVSIYDENFYEIMVYLPVDHIQIKKFLIIIQKTYFMGIKLLCVTKGI